MRDRLEITYNEYAKVCAYLESKGYKIVFGVDHRAILAMNPGDDGISIILFRKWDEFAKQVDRLRDIHDSGEVFQPDAQQESGIWNHIPMPDDEDMAELCALLCKTIVCDADRAVIDMCVGEPNAVEEGRIASVCRFSFYQEVDDAHD